MLSNKGLTSSEANHITNVVKELTKELGDITMPIFTSKILRGDKLHAIDEHVKRDSWVKDVKRVGELYSLSAWLKTAIKHKETLMDDVRVREVKLPSYTDSQDTTIKWRNTSFDGYLQTLSVLDTNTYLSAEAIASHVGKFIHNFDRVREVSSNFKPTTFQDFGGEMVTIFNERLYSNEELLKGFYDLQKEHRESERVVNYFKSKHKEWQKVQEDEMAEERILKQQEDEKFKLKIMTLQNEIREREEAKKREEIHKISQMKIIVPSELQSTLDYINTYAKFGDTEAQKS